MTIYEVRESGLVRLTQTTFAEAGIRERLDLQKFIREQIEIVSPDTLIIAEEFGEWEESRRRIDLLGIDKDANLVVIELKRTEDGGHMELQAIRYAAMVSELTFDNAIDIYGRYLSTSQMEDDPRVRMLEFLGWDEPDEERFAKDVRVVLASAEFSKEITTSVLWLNAHGLDVRCVRMRPYRDGQKILLDVQQVIPLPEAVEYQIRVRDKARLERVSRTQQRDLTKYDVVVGHEEMHHLPKRRAIFSLIKFLCESGVDPERVREIISWKGNAMRVVPGMLNSEAFERALADQLLSEGNEPQTHRYFINDSELIHANGRTYAVTKMWGTSTVKAMDQLVQAFPKIRISFVESL